METPLVIPGFVVISVFWRVVRGIGVIDYGRRRPTSFFFFLKLTQEIGKNPAKSRIVKSGQGGSGGQFFRPLIECLLFRKSALKCPFLDGNGRFFL